MFRITYDILFAKLQVAKTWNINAMMKHAKQCIHGAMGLMIVLTALMKFPIVVSYSNYCCFFKNIRY